MISSEFHPKLVSNSDKYQCLSFLSISLRTKTYVGMSESDLNAKDLEESLKNKPEARLSPTGSISAV